MADEFQQVRDLFGDLVTLASGRRGRPAHEATQKNRNKVIMLLAMGWNNERIAHALHVSLPTLRKHYFSELRAREMQRDRFDAWRFETLADKAGTGDVSAMKELGRMVERNDRMRAAAIFDEDDLPKKQPEGKKAQAKMAAKDALRDDAWGGDLLPGGSVN